MPHHWRPLTHERNSIFKCKQTVNGPWGPEQYDYTMMSLIGLWFSGSPFIFGIWNFLGIMIDVEVIHRWYTTLIFIFLIACQKCLLLSKKVLFQTLSNEFLTYYASDSISMFMVCILHCSWSFPFSNNECWL